jgi:hypothetical protein
MAATHFSGPVVSENGFQNGASSVETIAAATTLTAADSGKTFIMNAAGGAAITLPAVTNTGWSGKFIVGAVFATTDWTVVSADADAMEGAMMVASTVVNVDAATTLTFVATAENIGDWATVQSDGTYWYVDGRALTTAALTATG